MIGISNLVVTADNAGGKNNPDHNACGKNNPDHNCKICYYIRTNTAKNIASYS
jgi:hypothetical protein